MAGYLGGNPSKKLAFGITIILLFLGIKGASSSAFTYPPAHRDDSVENTYKSDNGNVKIKDPYRWLEDPDSEDTKEFISRQNKLFYDYVNSNPEKDSIKEKLTTLNNFPTWDFPKKIGDWYYFSANDGLQDQNVFFRSKTWHRENPEVVFDPNKLSTGEDVITVAGSSFNKDASIFAYATSKNGLDWSTIHFLNTTSGTHLPEKLEKVKVSGIVWNKMEGVFYGRYAHLIGLEPIKNQKLMYHRLGTSQSEDVVIAEFLEHPEARIGQPVTLINEGNAIIVHMVGAGKYYGQNALFTADIPQNITGKLKLRPLLPLPDAEHNIITVENGSVLVKTDKNAPNWRLVRINLDEPDEAKWETVIEEHPNMSLAWVTIANKDKLIYGLLDDGLTWIRVKNLTDGSILVDRLPIERLNVYSFSSPEPEIFLFKAENATNPLTVYMLNFTKGLTNIEIYEHIKLKSFNTDDVISKEVFFPSYDGTLVHMFIVHRKSLKLDGSSFALMWGYGGFNNAIMPVYLPYRAILLEHFNAVIALPNIRGGGEYGRKWNHGGQFKNKQKVFDDFLSAAEYLIKHGYTSNKKLWIEGRSNGGLLIGACINQRPDLFGAAIAHVGVMDMLRFPHFTMGHPWLIEFGNPEDPNMFDYIRKYSPLHNLKMPTNESMQYPSTLVVTGTHDDRVVPSHSLKYAAEMQYTIGAHERQTNPIMLRTDFKTGHVPKKPTSLLVILTNIPKKCLNGTAEPYRDFN
ncbi:unnamed protein product [Orchesella dallaii]|uniref:Prolyl endopeptidase n=1 Tax=Orchesella dallaii TaxID=48710 RepID=A0ABP1Q284_9HEXA